MHPDGGQTELEREGREGIGVDRLMRCDITSIFVVSAGGKPAGIVFELTHEGCLQQARSADAASAKSCGCYALFS